VHFFRAIFSDKFNFSFRWLNEDNAASVDPLAVLWLAQLLLLTFTLWDQVGDSAVQSTLF
jgi:hypothetical protein